MGKFNTIMAVKINKRSEAAPTVQKILTKYGCIIKIRLGIHEVEVCEEDGLVLLSVCGSEEDINNLEKELSQLDKVIVRRMNLD